MTREGRARAILTLSILLSGCGVEEPSRDDLIARVDQLESEKSELQEKVETLTEQVDDAREKVARVSSAADDVQDASRFNGENWREVVPDVQSASDDLDTAKDQAVQSVEEQ